MNIEHFRRKLLERKRELANSSSSLIKEARQSDVVEAEDRTDQATSTESDAVSFQEAGIERGELEEVEDALRRIDEGTYGKCIDCGRPIEPNRLEAVPWTPYCFDDQKKHDAANANAAADSRL